MEKKRGDMETDLDDFFLYMTTFFWYWGGDRKTAQVALSTEICVC
jgi:hypothetical protein